ncbi:MAG: nucleoside deaminase [Spirochaetia bacterium]
MTKEDFLKEAINLAVENVHSGNGGPFGAVVVKDGKIIAKGANSVTGTHDPTAHAEIVAIRRACKELDSFQLADCEIYSSCEPCPMCLGAIYWARPKALYFAADQKDASSVGFDDSFIYDELSLPAEQRSIPTYQVNHTEKLRPFKAWEEFEEKMKY